MACRTAHPFIGNIEETLGFATLGQFLPPFAAMLLLICVIASAVSTANSQLLLAASSLCYDLLPMKREGEGGPFGGERFLLANRIAITVIASVALLLGNAGLPGYIRLGTISWTLVAILYFYPLFTPKLVARDILFYVLLFALSAQLILVMIFGVEPEYAMLYVMLAEGLVFAVRRAAGGRHA